MKWGGGGGGGAGKAKPCLPQKILWTLRVTSECRPFRSSATTATASTMTTTTTTTTR